MTGVQTCALPILILEMKRRNPRFGCPRIAQQVSHAFGIEIDKDVVRRILAKHYRPKPGGEGPSWLTVIAEARDSLWSVDLFRCESILLKSFWGVSRSKRQTFCMLCQRWRTALRDLLAEAGPKPPSAAAVQ